MADSTKPELSEERLRLLVEAMAEHLGAADREAGSVVNVLITETLKFRNKLKDEIGEILTVADTRIALEALSNHFDGSGLSADLTPEQKALAQIWIDQLTFFKTN